MLRPPPITDNPPFVEIMTKLGLAPDPWQEEVLRSRHPQLLLNCCRQAGKSTVVAVLCLVEAIYRPMTKVVLVSRSHRQSREMLRTLCFFHDLLRNPLLKTRSAQELQLDNLSRIVSVPCREDTIRGYAGVDLLVIDEAARVPDDLYRAVRPMLAVSKGRLICLSTPYGKRGFFWDAWARGGDDWARIEIPASKCSRIGAEFLEQERRAMGESWYQQEYCCSFESVEGLVYPDFAKCVATELPAHVQAAVHRLDRESVRWLGGIDFGFRNPFAAVWGVVDRDDVLWLVGEHYARQKPLRHHAAKLPRHVKWYADPSSPSEISELRCAGFSVLAGKNAQRPGIAAVSARLADGTLRVLAGKCPNLLAEAGLYRHGDGETPIKDHDHALDALRYLISRLDARRMARSPGDAKEPPPAKKEWTLQERFLARMEDERYWIPLG